MFYCYCVIVLMCALPTYVIAGASKMKHACYAEHILKLLVFFLASSKLAQVIYPTTYFLESNYPGQAIAVISMNTHTYTQ